MNNIKVSVLVLTFNHESFIRECLESIITQQTSFNFEIIVHDDASTDQTQSVLKQIVKENPDKIQLLLQNTNQRSKGIVPLYEYSLPKSKGSYVAICEGDDYWIDKNKLQEQFELLETNPESNFTCHNYKVLKEKRILPKPGIITTSDFLKIDSQLLANYWIIQTLTLFMRKDRLDKMQKEVVGLKYHRDITMHYLLLRDEKNGLFINKVMGVYRIHDNGMHQGSPIKERLRSDLNTYNEIYKTLRIHDCSINLTRLIILNLFSLNWANIKLSIKVLLNFNIKDLTIFLGNFSSLIIKRLFKSKDELIIINWNEK